MKFINELKELYAIDKEALESMHDTHGFDFNKPVHGWTFNGAITINKIKKAMEPMSPESYKVLAFITEDSTSGSWWAREPQVIEITESGYEWESVLYSVPNMHTYNRKGDIETARKQPTAKTIVVAQCKAYLTAPVRIRRAWGGWDTHYPAIDEYDRITDTLYGCHITTTGRRVARVRNVQVDKSGYINLHYSELVQEAKRIRAEKDKAKYLTTTHDAEIETINKGIEDLKQLLIDELKMVTSYDDTRDLIDKLSYSGLAGILEKASYFETTTKAKGYLSIEASNNDYNRIIEAIDRTKNKCLFM